MRGRLKLPKLGRKAVERDELLLSQGLKTVALSFAAVFIPIYFYQLGYGLAGLLALYLAFELSALVLLRPAGYAIARFGPNRMLILSYVLTLSYLSILSGVKEVPELLAAFVLLSGAAVALEMTAVHTVMSAARERGRVGREVGTYEAIMKVSRAIGPIIGAGIATVFGPEDLFLSAAIIVALGALPLLATKDLVRQHKVDYPAVKWGSIRDEMTSIGGRAVPVFVGAQLWPIYVFLALGSFAGVGAVYSLAFGLSIMAIILAGRLIDRGSGRDLIRWGAFLDAGAYGLRTVATGFAPMMGATLVGSVGASFINGAWISRFYERAAEGRRIEYIVKVDIAARLWAITAAGFLLLLTQVFSELTVLRIAFVMGGAAAFLALRMPAGSRKVKASEIHTADHMAPSRA